MLLHFTPESPTFDYTLDNFDHYTSDMEDMSVSTDDQSVSEFSTDSTGHSHQQQQLLQHDQDQQSLQLEHGSQKDQEPNHKTSSLATPKKKRIRKTRAKVKSPELILKLKTSRRQRANDRERNRMHGLNEALEVLRTTLPNSTDAKMTKIETLRYACNYISALAASVKLLEQNKDRDDFGHEIPNPDDYAFMLNYQYGGENDQQSPMSPSPLSALHRGICDYELGFNSPQQFCSQQQQRQHQINANSGLSNAQHHQQQHGVVAHNMNCMNTTPLNDNFLFQDSPTSFPSHHHHHQQQQQRQQSLHNDIKQTSLQSNSSIPFMSFLEDQAKNRLSSSLFQNTLGSLGCHRNNFFDTPSFSQAQITSIPTSVTPSAAFNSPSTSPDLSKPNSGLHTQQQHLQQQQQQQQQRQQQHNQQQQQNSPAQHSLSSSHEYRLLQEQKLMQSFVLSSPANTSAFSSSPLPLVAAQYL